MNSTGRRGARARLTASAVMVVAILFEGMIGVRPANAQVIQAGALEVDLTGRVQVQLNTTSVDGDDVADPPASSAFEMRRVRLGAGFGWSDWITGKVEGAFAGSGARLADGWVDVALWDSFQLRAGQFKKPFGLIELESSTQIRTIERGLRIRGLSDLVGLPGETQLLLDASGYLGRQIGVMAHGDFGAFSYGAGVFNGEGANVREAYGTKAYAARLNYGVLEPLVVGAAVSVEPTGVFEGEDEVHGTAWALEASWGGFRRPGLHAKAEWMVGENVDSDVLAAVAGVPTMTGVHGLVAWFEPWTGRVEGIEPVLRVSWADPDTDAEEDQGLLVTPGLNLYFNGRNRLMFNGDVYFPGQDGLNAEYALIAQLQVYF